MTPRVFISSTFYDLKFIREELANFVRSYNFEPILFEQGDVGYIHGRNPDESCYKEMSHADMVILIIGGRYGSPASGEVQENFKEYLSVTRKEFNTAVEENIPVYVFVDANVYSEYNVYAKNRTVFDSGKANIHFAATDNINVFRFIDAIFMLKYICVTGFTEAQDIKIFLKKQWADMFKEYLMLLKEKANRENVMDSVNAVEKLIREMGIMVQKMGEKVIGEKTVELEDVLEEQQIENMANIIANAFTFVALPQDVDTIKAFFLEFVGKIAECCRKNLFINLLSEDTADNKEFYDYFESTNAEIFIGNVKEEIGFSMEPYRDVFISGKLKNRLADRLTREEYLEKMQIYVKA